MVEPRISCGSGEPIQKGKCNASDLFLTSVLFMHPLLGMRLIELRPRVGGIACLEAIGESTRSSSVGPVKGGKQIKQRLRNEDIGEKAYGVKRTL
jgi:hypothetical protein